MECLKNIFTHRVAYALPPREAISETYNHQKSLSKLVSLIKRRASAKTINGKAVNGNMLIGLALEYAETLSQQ